MKTMAFITTIILCSNLFAKSCPDSMTIDQLPLNKTYITVNKEQSFNHPKTANQAYAAGKNTATKKIIFEDGYMREMLLNWFMHPGRFIQVVFEDYNAPDKYSGSTFVLTHKKVKLDPVQPKRPGYIVDIDLTKTQYIFQSEFTFTKINSDDPLAITLTPNRGLLDPRQRKYITLSSLRYNLGKDFTIDAECD
jgi:hypothetical protein